MSGGGIYESIAARLEASGCMRPGGVELTQRALSRCSFLPGARVLDIGCGVGGTVEYLMRNHQLNAIGIDPSLTILGLGHTSNAALPLVAADGAALPFGNAAWDGVLAECSLSLVKDARKMLSECWRVLRNKGWLVLSDVYLRVSEARDQARRLPSTCCLAGAMTREELLETLAACGFQTVHWEDHSPALKTFAAQLILSHGSSIEELWWRAAQDKGESTALPELRKVMTRARPGYFLLIAHKSARR
jgi:arsenite methyltransferase